MPQLLPHGMTGCTLLVMVLALMALPDWSEAAPLESATMVGTAAGLYKWLRESTGTLAMLTGTPCPDHADHCICPGRGLAAWTSGTVDSYSISCRACDHVQ